MALGYGLPTCTGWQPIIIIMQHMATQENVRQSKPGPIESAPYAEDYHSTIIFLLQHPSPRMHPVCDGIGVRKFGLARQLAESCLSRITHLMMPLPAPLERPEACKVSGKAEDTLPALQHSRVRVAGWIQIVAAP